VDATVIDTRIRELGGSPACHPVFRDALKGVDGKPRDAVTYCVTYCRAPAAEAERVQLASGRCQRPLSTNVVTRDIRKNIIKT